MQRNKTSEREEACRKMEALDMEMSKRIQDLHREMTDNGLKHLAQMLQRCFDTNTGHPKQTIGNKDQGKLRCRFHGNNSNQNANY